MLNKFGRQNNMRIILPVQTRTSDEGVISYLTATSLSGSKQIKEVANSLILCLRKGLERYAWHYVLCLDLE